MRPTLLILAWLAITSASLNPSPALADDPVRVYRGATVLTATKGEIADADLVVKGGKIVAVGKKGEITAAEGAEIVDLKEKWIIPGLVDSHSHIGIYPKPGIEAHQDGNEVTGPVQAGLRALDAIWPDDPGIPMALAGGVTTANIMPGSANAIGGQTLYVKLRPGPVANMAVTPGQPSGGLKMANGENPKRAYGGKNQAPATRMRLASLQREQFLKAQDYRRKWQTHEGEKAQGKTSTEPDRDLSLDPLVEVLDRKRTVHFHSHRADDIMTVMRLADEFGFEVVIQHGTEAYKVADELGKRKAWVSLTLPDSPGGKAEVDDLIEQNAALLDKAGVKIAINSDDSVTESRFLLHTASLAVRGGLSAEKALRALTIQPAEMMHLESRIGSIEPGKDADFVVLSGRPFSVYTHVLQTYIEGVKRFDRADPRQANYAIGGFALADPSKRPTPAPSLAKGAGSAAAAAPLTALPKGTTRFAIHASTVYPASKPPITNGVVIIADGKIVSVGPFEGTPIPKETPILTARAVTPGLIDAHTVVGVSGRLNIPADQDHDEKTDPNQAEVRILDSFNPDEPLLWFALSQGVTLIQAMPGPADVIAGQAGVFRTFGTTADAMTVRFPSALVFNLGETPKSTYPGKAPSTRMGTAAMIRNALTGAVNDRRKRLAAKPGSAALDRNLKLEALALVLDKKLPAVFSAHRADDLTTALRLSTEFGLDPVLSLASEGYLIADAIAASKAPVLVHPTMQRPGAPETMNTTLNNAALLADKGIPVAITSAYESYVPKTRVPRYEAAVALVNGLGAERALRALTLDAARILKVDDRFGSLEKGKVADVVLYDGDPFETTTHVTHVVVGGRLAYDRAAESRNPRRGAGSGSFTEPACCLSR